MMKLRVLGLMLVVAVLGIGMLAWFGSQATAKPFGAWGPAQSSEQSGGSDALNTAALEGCPIQSPDGLSLYFASDRDGGVGGIDIWVAQRASTDDPWSAPTNLAPINSSADDFCPTPLRASRLFFVSTRTDDGACGGADIYETRLHPVQGWLTPQNLGCEVNSPAAEFSPSLVNENGVNALYFSSNRAGGLGGHDIYRSSFSSIWNAPVLVPGLNTEHDDARPNVRKDGLEIVFDSTRPGGLGGPDIWSASRPDLQSGWSEPVNLGPNVNSESGETRASLSWDGETLQFGSNRPGGEGNSDIYFSTRSK
jgi:hypothetical protein